MARFRGTAVPSRETGPTAPKAISDGNYRMVAHQVNFASLSIQTSRATRSSFGFSIGLMGRTAIYSVRTSRH